MLKDVWLGSVEKGIPSYDQVLNCSRRPHSYSL